MKQSLIKQTATAIKSTHTQLVRGNQPVQKQTSNTTKRPAEDEHMGPRTSSGNTSHKSSLHRSSSLPCFCYAACSDHWLVTVMIPCSLSGTFFRPEVYARYIQLLKGHAEHAENLEDLQVWLTCCYHSVLMILCPLYRMYIFLRHF